MTIRPEHINHRTKGTETKNYAELYPGINNDCLLTDITVPDSMEEILAAGRFKTLVVDHINM